MTAQFAGSRSLDDRRRRRLAKESGDAIDTITPPTTSSKAGKPVTEEESPTVELATDVVAEESLIPQALWKVSLYGLLGFGFWSLLFWTNFSRPQFHGLEQTLSPTTGQAFRFFSTVCLLISSQLSFVIWWYRARSRKDFSGRYRIWMWSGIFWGVACACLGLDLHSRLAQLAYQQWPLHTWRPDLMYWLVPFSIGTLSLYQLLSLDMRHSKLSRFFWNVTFITGLFAVSLKLGIDLTLSESARLLAIALTTTLWHFLISFSLLIHARFVVHVTNEAAPRKRSRLGIAKDIFLKKTSGVRAKLSASSESRAQKRAELRELRLAEKAKAKEEKELARMLKAEQAEEQRKQKEEERLAAKQAREQQKAEEKQKREQAAAEKQQQKESTAAKQTPVKADAKTEEPKVDARTNTGKKRKRVLGNKTRIDVAEPVNATHIEESPNEIYLNTEVNYADDFENDYGDDDDEDYSHMSKKQRRRARKRKKQRSR